ncbi:MAG TPA: DUF4349 domain-containing protein [Lachnospiraceae bacterium]|nr:DUF4349 domain-containing protein [Lachnospiraceae bacterium]
MRGIKKSIFVTGVVMFAFLAGCGASSKSANDYSDYGYAENSLNTDYGMNTSMEEEAVEEYATTSESPSESVREGRKLIRTAKLSVETLEFDNLLSYVEDRTNEYGGYMESLDVYNGSDYGYDNDYYESSYSGMSYSSDRRATLTIRIPKDKMDSFLGEVAEHSNITSRSEQEQDVTLSYVDLESHKAVLLAEQERLLQFLEQAETIEDMITIESRLSDIRYQIESMESTLRTYDNQIDYSTIYLSIDEVIVLTPVITQEKTIWERISEGFMSSIKNIGVGFKEFFVGLVIVLPYLILMAAFVLLIIWFIFFCIRRGTKKRQKREAKLRAEQMNAMQQMSNQNGMIYQNQENRGKQ